MSNGILDELLDDPETVFGDATIRTRFDTAAVNITGADPAPVPGPDPMLDRGQVEVQRSGGEKQSFEGEDAIAEAISVAKSDDTIFAGPGLYSSNKDRIEVSAQGIDLIGPQAGIPGDSPNRVPEDRDDIDPASEAIIDTPVYTSGNGIIIDGFALVEDDAPDDFSTGLLIEDVEAEKVALYNNIVFKSRDSSAHAVGIDFFHPIKIFLRNNFMSGVQVTIIRRFIPPENTNPDPEIPNLDSNTKITVSNNTFQDSLSHIDIIVATNSESLPQSDASDTGPIEIVENKFKDLKGRRGGVKLTYLEGEDPGDGPREFLENNNVFNDSTGVSILKL